MSVIIETGQILTKTSAGLQTTTLSKFPGDTPIAIMLTSAHATAAGITTNAIGAVGFATSSTNRACCWHDDGHNQQSSDSSRGYQTTRCLDIPDGNGVVNYQIDFDSFGTNQFTLDYEATNATQRIINYMVIGGTEITDATVYTFASPTISFSQAYTGVGFQGQGMLCASAGRTATGAATNNMNSFAAVGADGAVRCIAMSCQDADMKNENRYRRWSSAGLIKINHSGASINEKATFTSWDSDGFTLNWTSAESAAREWLALIIRGRDIAVAHDQVPTSVGTKATTLTIQPEAVVGFSHGGNAASETDDAGSSQWHLGVADDTTDKGIGSSGADNVDPSDTGKTQQDRILSILNNAGTAENHAGNLDSLDSNGATVDWTTVGGIGEDDYYILAGIESAQPGTDGGSGGWGQLAWNISQSRYPSMWVDLEGLWVPSSHRQGGNRFLADRSHNRGDMIITGATWTGSSRGSVLSFDGTNDYCRAENMRGLPDTDGVVSILAWVRTTTTSGTRNMVVINDGASQTRSVQLEMRSSTLRASKVGGTALVDSAVTPTVNHWHHVAFTTDGTTHRFYVDGQFKASNTTAQDAGAADNAWLGSFNGSSELWSGLMDDVRIYSRQLSADDVARAYAHQSPLRRREMNRMGIAPAAPASSKPYYYTTWRRRNAG